MPANKILKLSFPLQMTQSVSFCFESEINMKFWKEL